VSGGVPLLVNGEIRIKDLRRETLDEKVRNDTVNWIIDNTPIINVCNKILEGSRLDLKSYHLDHEQRLGKIEGLKKIGEFCILSAHHSSALALSLSQLTFHLTIF